MRPAREREERDDDERGDAGVARHPRADGGGMERVRDARSAGEHASPPEGERDEGRQEHDVHREGAREPQRAELCPAGDHLLHEAADDGREARDVAFDDARPPPELVPGQEAAR